jgi:hypothetical protein
MKRKTIERKYETQDLSRRKILQLLAGLGISGPAALELVAQSRQRLSPDILKTANAIVDQEFREDRLQVITAALQRNLDQFQIVRDLEIDDLIEPAPIFMAKGR